ncbi:MAG: ribonuclease III [Verrucomicrobiota bacterium]
MEPTDSVNGQRPTAEHLQQLQERIQYTFQDISLLHLALTHPSWALTSDNPSLQNQRLEFLGDAALSLVLSDFLYRTEREMQEGPLSRRRSALVKGEILAQVAHEIGLSECLYLGSGEMKNFKRGETSRLEDAFESLIGAIYLDGGQKLCHETVLHIYGDIDARLDEALEDHNAKGRLQEWVQKHGALEDIEYTIIEVEGPDHEKEFKVELEICRKRMGIGIGNSRKRAEHFAAKDALERIEAGSSPYDASEG